MRVGTGKAFCTSRRCEAPSLLAAACAFSGNQTDRSERQKLSDVKRNVKRFPVNGCQRFRCSPTILSIFDVPGNTT
jgi:hypothetical protein